MKLSSYMDSVPYHLCFETLANQLRIQIIRELEKQPLTVGEIAEKTHAEQSRVSHSLQMLKLCSYVDSETKGKERVYFLKKGVSEGMLATQNSAGEVLNFADSHFTHYCNCECAKTKQ